LAGDRRGDPGRAGPVHRHERRVPPAGQGHEAADQGAEAAADPVQVEGQAETAARLQVFITARRVRIDPEEKRREYIERLERLIEGLDKLANNRRVERKTRLRAVEVMVKVINTCYGIVRDIEVEMLEREFEELETEAEGEAEGSEGLYGVEEDPAG